MPPGFWPPYLLWPSLNDDGSLRLPDVVRILNPDEFRSGAGPVIAERWDFETVATRLAHVAVYWYLLAQTRGGPRTAELPSRLWEESRCRRRSARGRPALDGLHAVSRRTNWSRRPAPPRQHAEGCSRRGIDHVPATPASTRPTPGSRHEARLRSTGQSLRMGHGPPDPRCQRVSRGLGARAPLSRWSRWALPSARRRGVLGSDVSAPKPDWPA